MNKVVALLNALRPWTWLALVVVVCTLSILQMRGCNELKRAKSDLATAQEAKLLAEQHQIVVVRDTDIEQKYGRMLEANKKLAEQNAKLQKLVDAKPVAVLHAETVPVVVDARPSVISPTPTCGCLLSPGDKLQLKIDAGVLKTEGNNRVLLGTAAAYRLDNGTPVMLLQEPFSTPVSWAEEVAAADPHLGWGAGPWAGIGSAGWAAGVAVGVPSFQLPLLKWRTEFSAGGGIGPNGVYMGSAQLILRP